MVCMSVPNVVFLIKCFGSTKFLLVLLLFSVDLVTFSKIYTYTHIRKFFLLIFPLMNKEGGELIRKSDISRPIVLHNNSVIKMSWVKILKTYNVLLTKSFFTRLTNKRKYEGYNSVWFRD